MINKDGSYGPRATQSELAALYGRDVMNMLSYSHEVIAERWQFHTDLVYQQACIAAHHARKALRQSKLR